jgi:hypothetical protein
MNQIEVSLRGLHQESLIDLSGGRNRLIYDNQGEPSVMVAIPKFKIGSDVHPAFLKANGDEIDVIWVSKYQNIVVNSRGYSLPYQNPRTGDEGTTDFDAAAGFCSAKGAGWHLMTNAEWAAIAMMRHELYGHLVTDFSMATAEAAERAYPSGNNDYGRDVTRTWEVGETARAYYDVGVDIQTILTGSGPNAWSHDKSPWGVFNLNGNIWEWVWGLKLAASTQYYIVPLDTGAAFAVNGYDVIEASWTSLTAAVIPASASGITALHASDLKEKYLCLPETVGGAVDEFDKDFFYKGDATVERLALRGGAWHYGTNAGLFHLYLYHARTYSNLHIGFRSAYIGSL